jgi:8-oxo-dGTP pyrophosphatase MutT (NUDIX family)
LLGRRRLDQVFMAGKYVFPGGRVDPADMRLTISDGLAETELAKLGDQVTGDPSPRRRQAYALAAVRETFEETGLLVGSRSEAGPESASSAWRAFMAHGIVPRLSRMSFIARAITPPGRPRRYDTRFFCVDASEIAARVDAQDGELTELHWLTFDEARRFDLPTIQAAILEDLAERLAGEGLGPSRHPVPFYHMRAGVYRRDLLTVTPTP